MNTWKSDFFRELAAVIVGCVLAVATVAFVSIPAVLSHHPGEPRPVAGLVAATHLT